MTKEIKELSNTLITEIQKLIANIEYLSDDNKFENFQDDSTYSNKERLQKQETWYDQIHEKYLNIRQIYENAKHMKKNVKKYFEMINEMTKSYEKKKEEFSNKLDSFLLEDMMKTEKELKSETFTKKYEKMNYEEYIAILSY